MKQGQESEREQSAQSFKKDVLAALLLLLVNDDVKQGSGDCALEQSDTDAAAVGKELGGQTVAKPRCCGDSEQSHHAPAGAHSPQQPPDR